jgi:hypothetical protein
MYNTVEPRFTNKFCEQKHLGWRTVSRIMNTQAGNRGKLRVSARECQLLVNQLSFGLRTFRFTNGLQERIKFVNRGSTVFRFEIVVFSVMGPCNVNVQHRRFGLDLLLPSSDGLCRLLNIHNHGCTRLYGVLTQTTLWNLTIVGTSNPKPEIIKNWNSDGNDTLGKMNHRRT